MKISNLNTKVMLQEMSMISDNFGGFITTWIDHEEIWANVTPHKISNNQKNESASIVTHKIIIRTRPELSNKFRIIFNDKNLEFHNVRFVDNSQRFQEIYATQR